MKKKRVSECESNLEYAGDGDNYFALPASDIINVVSMSNVNIPGVFMFRVDSAENKQGRF
jgi:hypothetical protein